MVASKDIGKREHQRLDRRNRILDVAGAAFLEDGYAGTAMSSIAGKLGGSKGTLWSYFSSKEELFEAFVRREAVAEPIALEADADIRTSMAALCTDLVRRATSPERLALLRAVVSQSGLSPTIGRIFHDSGAGRTELLLTEYLRQQVEEKKLRRADPEEMARYLLSMCVGRSAYRALLGIGDPSAQQEGARIADQFLSLYIKGALKKRKGRKKHRK